VSVPSIDPESIDLATLAWLAGVSANEHLLQRTRAGGHSQIRNSHGYVFQHLIGGPRAIGELASLLGVTQQAASKVVAELTELGYVERRSDAIDSRVRRVALTARGRAVIERSRAARSKLEAELVAELGTRAVATARRTLLALLARIGGLEAVAKRRAEPPSD
jgi:DNA-binding MarR family transcriptional regulator